MNSTENARLQKFAESSPSLQLPLRQSSRNKTAIMRHRPPALPRQDLALMQPLGASTALGPCHPGLAGRQPLGSRWPRLQA